MNVNQTIKQAREQIDVEIKKLNAIRSALGKFGLFGQKARIRKTTKPVRRKLSKNGRAKIIAAQKKRWAKVKKNKKGVAR